MSVSWPKVPLGVIAPVRRRPVDVVPEGVYHELGIRSFGKGTFHKAPVEGTSIGTKRIFRIEPGDLLFSNVFAWEGAIAVAQPSDANRVGSHRFITCRVDTDRAVPEFLCRYLLTPEGIDQVRRASPGGAGRNRTLGLEKLAKIMVPVPPLAEQQRIAGQIGALEKLILEAQCLRDEARQDRDALCRSILAADTKAQLVPMAELVTLRAPDVVVRPDEIYQFAGVYSFGRGVFRGQAKTGIEFAYTKLATLKAGDFTYPKLMAWEGAFGVVPHDCDGYVVSPEFPVFAINQGRVLPEVLDVHFRNPAVWPEFSGASTGTNVRRRRLNPQDFLKYRMPVPSMGVQQRLRDVMRELAHVRPIAYQVGVELDALLPAMLDRAFKGELTRMNMEELDHA